MRIGVVIPVLLAFQEAIKALHCIKTSHIWTPYIGPQWEENRAISAVWNEKSRQAFSDGCEAVIILNDDAFVYPHCIDALVQELFKEEDNVLISGVNTHVEFNAHESPDLYEANLNFSCFAIKPYTFESIGYFDENFYPAYYDDNDFHRRIILSGKRAYGISTGEFYHIGSVTSNELKLRSEEFNQQFAACRDYYISKWGNVPDAECYDIPYNDSNYTIKTWRTP